MTVLKVVMLTGAVVLYADSAPAQVYTGACDGSALVPVKGKYFLNASDEDNVLRLYQLGTGGKPIATFDLGDFLKPEVNKRGRRKEVDLEAAAVVGDRVYWTGSHGRDKGGEEEPSRQRLFATRIEAVGSGIKVTPVGRPYTGLLNVLKAGQLKSARILAEAEKKPHLAGGIDIEGLAATRNGTLLIGFRSPLVDNKALIIEITNPGDVLKGSTEARVGTETLLDLGGSGIRDIVQGSTPDEFFIVAGDLGDKFGGVIYRWILNGRPIRLGHTLPANAGAIEGMLHTANGMFAAADGGDVGGCKGRAESDRSFTVINIPNVSNK
jgi:hypothetical protein